MIQLQRVGSHGNHDKIKTVIRLRATRGGGFVTQRFSKYNRGKE